MKRSFSGNLPPLQAIWGNGELLKLKTYVSVKFNSPECHGGHSDSFLCRAGGCRTEGWVWGPWPVYIRVCMYMCVFKHVAFAGVYVYGAFIQDEELTVCMCLHWIYKNLILAFLDSMFLPRDGWFFWFRMRWHWTVCKWTYKPHQLHVIIIHQCQQTNCWCLQV